MKLSPLPETTIRAIPELTVDINLNFSIHPSTHEFHFFQYPPPIIKIFRCHPRHPIINSGTAQTSIQNRKEILSFYQNNYAAILAFVNITMLQNFENLIHIVFEHPLEVWSRISLQLWTYWWFISVFYIFNVVNLSHQTTRSAIRKFVYYEHDSVKSNTAKEEDKALDLKF